MATIPKSKHQKNDVQLYAFNTDSNTFHAVTITETGAIEISEQAISDTPEFFEDTDFVSGDSPIVLDINTALGRNATSVLVLNDGPGSFTIEHSADGVSYGDAITLKQREYRRYKGMSVDSLRITHSGTDSAYRVEAI